MKNLPNLALGVCTFAALCGSTAYSGEIHFGGNSHGLTGQASRVISAGSYEMLLAAGPAGALLHEQHGQALGVDTRGIGGGTDGGDLGSPDKLNLMTGANAVDGVPETISFSFSHSGVLHGLLFDGIKDETLEFARLTLPSGESISFFDFEVGFRLEQQGYSLTWLAPAIPRLLDGPDDDITQLGIAFEAGEQFTLSYGEFPFPAGYVPLTPNQPPNGLRWQGLVLAPEPTAAELAATAFCLTMRSTRRKEAERSR